MLCYGRPQLKNNHDAQTVNCLQQGECHTKAEKYIVRQTKIKNRKREETEKNSREKERQTDRDLAEKKENNIYLNIT